MEQVDVIVIGAGIAGASAAYELSANASVLLLEREDRPGYHTTGRSAAVFAPAYGNRPIRQLTRASEAFYHADAGGLAERAVLHPRGELLIARSDQLDALDRAEAALRREIDGLLRLDADAVAERVPALRSGYVAAALADEAAMDMDVAAIHQGFLDGFRRRGGRLSTDAEVTALRRGAAGWDVTTKAGSCLGEVVVNAGGAWADEIADLAGADRIGLVPKRRTAFIFDPEATIDPGWPAVIDVDEAFYFKPESGLLLGSPADETPSPPTDAQPEELDVAIAVDRLERATDWTIARITRRWAGLRSFVADKTPVVGFDPACTGFFWLTGQGGYGIQTAPALARVAAALALGKPLPADIAATGLQADHLAPGRSGLGQR
ncbi:MAG: NAD(P)/FAD-dependent oxidoreductase [Geminicoccaceae bacterium]